MKKNLLLSSALVAAGLFVASDAFAQAKPMSLSVGGYWHVYYQYTDQDHNATNLPAGAVAQGGALRVRDAFYNDGEIIFSGRTTLDNGLQVGFQVEYEMDGQADAIDEVFMDLRGSFGRVVIGQFDSAAREMQRVAPSGSRSYLNGINEMGFQTDPFSGLYNAAGTSTFNSGDGEKIVYFSPVFSGFQAGVSYGIRAAENPVAGGGLAVNWITADNAGGGANADAMITYNGKFGDVGVAAGLGYQWADQRGTVGFYRNNAGVAVVNAHVDPVQTYLGHLIFSFAGFDFGGTFASHNFDLLNQAAGTRNDLENFTWDLGVSYTTGPWRVGAAMFRGDFETLADNSGGFNPATGGSFKTQKYLVNASYLLGPGITVESGIGWEKFDYTGSQPDQKGTTFFIGSRLGF